ncbi:MAG: XdhC family protein, partial [Saprospiraceae bacterium]|nr:XdhC family protein [Saprospiraceae bacterium]
MKEIRKIIEDYDFNKSFLKCSLVSVVHVEGSSYRRVGARMLVYENGVCLGGISGGCLEGDALRKAQKAIYSDSPTVVRYDTSQDDEHQIGVGLGCRGIIDVLITPIDKNDPDNQIEVLRKCLDKRYPQVILTVIEDKSQHKYLGTISNFAERKDSPIE